MAGAFEYKWREIAFDNLIPDNLDIDLQQCWNGMGMDDKGRIYIGFTSFRDQENLWGGRTRLRIIPVTR